jgi:hypothetical protein
VEASIGRFFPGFVGFVKEACWSIQERLVGGKSFRMWEGVGSERRGYWLGKRRILPKEEGVGEETKTTEMVNGEWEECYVFLVYGCDDVLVGVGAMCSAT